MTRMNKYTLALQLMLLQLACYQAQAQQSSAKPSKICTSPNNVFHVRVDLFASELGHYMFDECGNDQVNPTLGLIPGVQYTFVQSDRSNFFHPLGIAGMAAQESFWSGTNELSRNRYERSFVEAPSYWKGYDTFSVQVTLPLETNTATNTSVSKTNTANGPYLYYQCLLHAGMEGRIVLLPPSGDVNELEASLLDTIAPFVDSRNDFDKSCKTTGLSQFELPNPHCPDKFVCGTEGVTPELQHFASCLDAANCFMMSGMTTGVKATQDTALFIHQMIPHHQNAVNTAKVLLGSGSLLCPDLTDTSNPNCVLEGILREIVAGQNHQIQLMRKFLSDHQYPQKDNCDVYVQTVESPEEVVPTTGEGISKEGSNAKSSAAVVQGVATAAWILMGGVGWALGLC